MPIRLSRALLRVFPAILLVVVATLGALFRRRGGPRKGETARGPSDFGEPTPSRRRRGGAIALLVLLLGFGLIVALRDGAGGLKHFVSPAPGRDGEPPTAGESRTDLDAGRGNTAAATSPGGSPGRSPATASGTSDPLAPTFDTVRVEPNGDLVVAGRASPNAAVELLVDGKAIARAIADADGQFAIVPPALPPGNSEIGLRASDKKGFARRSRDSVAVAISPTRDAEPLVALTSPDKPTVVLSQPDPARAATRHAAARPVLDAPRLSGTMTGVGSPTDSGSAGLVPGDGSSNAAEARSAARSMRGDGRGDAGAEARDRTSSDGVGPRSSNAPEAPASEKAIVEGSEPAATNVVSVDAQDGGRLFVSGRAAAGASVRFYLNDTAIASAKAGRDGKVTFTIGRGVGPGDYKVRLDQVEAASGKVRSRVEVPFSVPGVAGIAEAGRPVPAPSEASANKDEGGTATSNASQPMASSPATGPHRSQAAGGAEGRRDSAPGAPATPATVGGPREPDTDSAVVFVPEVRTARIERGDSLWAISRRTYGEGDRYTVIYDANQGQIRDPDLIYPGQIFVLPSEDARDAGQDGKRG